MNTATGRRLPRRDFIILPLLVAATLAVMLGGAEVASRVIYPAHEADACYGPDGAGGHHFKPNCTSTTKVAEGPWVVNAYNACGYRTAEPCGPLPSGALRVGVVGSSTAAGYLTPYAQTFAARSARALTQACGGPVEFQNLSGPNYLGAKVIPRVAAAQKLDLNALVMVVTVVDMDLADNDRKASAGQAQAAPPSLFSRIKDVMQYFLLRSDETYLPFYLRVTSTAGFLQRPLPGLWSDRLAHLDDELGQMRARAQGVPFTLIFAPQRAAAAMRASGRPWPGFDAEALPDALARIAEKHGIAFVDATTAFPVGAPVNRYFYTVNGHLNGQGHELLSQAYLKRVTEPGGPFAGCRGMSPPPS